VPIVDAEEEYAASQSASAEEAGQEEEINLDDAAQAAEGASEELGNI
jgi:hypothetical protein